MCLKCEEGIRTTASLLTLILVLLDCVMSSTMTGAY